MGVERNYLSPKLNSAVSVSLTIGSFLTRGAFFSSSFGDSVNHISFSQTQKKQEPNSLIFLLFHN